MPVQPTALAFSPRQPGWLRTLACLLLALTGLGADVASAAGDPVAGKQLYFSTPGGRNCSDSTCHGSNVSKNQNRILAGANNPSAIQSAIDAGTGGMGIYRGVLSSTQVTDIAAYIGNPNVSTGPVASVSPSSLSFASTTVGSTSSSKTVTVANSGDQTLVLSGFSTSNSEFSISGGSCSGSSSLAVGSSCTLLVTFSPSAAGTRSGTLTINSNAAAGAATVALSGTGAQTSAATTIDVKPASLTFGSVAVGSASSDQTVTISNTGSGTLTLSSLAAAGANSGDFVLGGSCAAGLSLAAGRSCALNASFAPTATGSRSATVTIVSNASNGDQTVSLTGTGVSSGTPSAAASPVSLSFGSIAVGAVSGAQIVTVTNTGSAALVLSGVTLGGSDFAIAGGDCTAGLSIAASGGSCTLSIQFTPTSAGALASTLTITGNAAQSPLSVALSGTGVAAGSLARISPSSITLQTPAKGTRSALATLSNGGTAPLLIGTLGFTGTNAGDFSIGQASNCETGVTLAANDSCVVEIVFAPATTGTRTATLQVSHDDVAHSPSTVSLTGIASRLPQGEISASPSALYFADQAVPVSSAAQTVTITNTGSAKLSLQTLALGGSNAADFAIDRSSTCDASTQLSGGQSCALNFVFTPSVAGSRSAVVLIASKANGFNLPNLQLTLSGNGVQSAASLSLSDTLVNFGGTILGTTADSRTVTLSNTGSDPLTLQSISVSPAVFSVADDCPTTLAAAASCTLTLDFAPTTAGNYAGTVTIESSAPSSPDRLDVSGAGVTNGGVLQWRGASALSFAATTVGSSSAAATLTLTNTGTAAAQLSGFALGGDNPADFAPQAGDASACSLGTPLAVGDSCTLSYRFAPSAAGARSATLDVLSDGSAPPTATLSGSGLSAGGGTGGGSGTSSSATATNAGYGGCSLGTPGQPHDPVWALMLVLSAFALWLRRRPRPIH